MLSCISQNDCFTNNFVKSNFKNHTIENYNYLDSNSTIGIQIIPNSLGINELDYYGILFKTSLTKNLNNQFHILSNVNDLRQNYVFSIANLYKYDNGLFLSLNYELNYQKIETQIINQSTFNYGINLKVFNYSFFNLRSFNLFEEVNLSYQLLMDKYLLEFSYSVSKSHPAQLELIILNELLKGVILGIKFNSNPKSLALSLQFDKNKLSILTNINYLLDIGNRNEFLLFYDY